METKLTLSEKTAKTFLADVVPEAILGKADGRDLIVEFASSKTAAKQKQYTFIEGKTKVSKHAKGVLLSSKNLDVLLTKEDLKKIEKLL